MAGGGGPRSCTGGGERPSIIPSAWCGSPAGGPTSSLGREGGLEGCPIPEEQVTMSNELELVADEEGLAVVGNVADVERFFLSAGLDRLPSRDIDLQRLRSLTNTAGTGVGVAGDVAANSGRWVKLTADSAKAMHEFGLMAVKDGPPGVRHAMIGQPGDIGRWLQIDQASTMLLSGPFALTALLALSVCFGPGVTARSGPTF